MTRDCGQCATQDRGQDNQLFWDGCRKCYVDDTTNIAVDKEVGINEDKLASALLPSYEKQYADDKLGKDSQDVKQDKTEGSPLGKWWDDNNGGWRTYGDEQVTGL